VRCSMQAALMVEEWLRLNKNENEINGKYL
jgi:hypothetical protein